MPDPVERRVAQLEEMVESIPEALNIRFGRVDRNLAEMREQMGKMREQMGEIQERLTEHGRRLTEVERKLDLALSELQALPAVLARIIKENRDM
jgi:chromosome segregation ATPase